MRYVTMFAALENRVLKDSEEHQIGTLITPYYPPGILFSIDSRDYAKFLSLYPLIPRVAFCEQFRITSLNQFLCQIDKCNNFDRNLTRDNKE